MSIPVIGTPVVKNPQWVKRLYDSIDFPVDNFFIINNNGLGKITDELESIKLKKNEFVKNLFISHMPSNLGVACSWNLVIKSFVMSPYWVIVNDDVAFTPGLLQELHDKAADEKWGMIHPFQGDFNLGAWDFFLIKDWVVRTHGLFDENLYPAYCEDADYIMRLIVKPVEKLIGLEHKYLHGWGYCDQYYTYGSQTKKSTNELSERLEQVNVTNFDYLNTKWGTGWRNCQPQNNPFGFEGNDLKSTTWDIDFVRSKHLGF